MKKLWKVIDATFKKWIKFQNTNKTKSFARPRTKVDKLVWKIHLVTMRHNKNKKARQPYLKL